MKKSLLLAVLMAPIFFALYVPEAAATGVVSSTSAAVTWPDFKAKPWVLDHQAPMGTLVLYMPKGNSYVLEPGKFSVRIGTVSWYFDNADLNDANLAVAEVSILGNGPVFRRLMTREISDVDSQVMVKGKWVSLPPRSLLLFMVSDEESVITKNQMSSVVMKVLSADGKVLLQQKLDNKNQK